MGFGAKDVDVDVDADVVKGYEAVLAKNGKFLGLTESKQGWHSQ
jgi:hypothetical protein